MSLRVGHYLHVLGVVTKRVVDFGEIGEGVRHLISHGIGKRYWKEVTLQRRVKRAKHADGSLDCPPSRDTLFSPQGTSRTLDLRVLIGQVWKETLERFVKCAMGMEMVSTMFSESDSFGTGSVESPFFFPHSLSRTDPREFGRCSGKTIFHFRAICEMYHHSSTQLPQYKAFSFHYVPLCCTFLNWVRRCI